MTETDMKGSDSQDFSGELLRKVSRVQALKMLGPWPWPDFNGCYRFRVWGFGG